MFALNKVDVKNQVIWCIKVYSVEEIVLFLKEKSNYHEK